MNEQLNIWLKATYIHNILKCLATDDEDAKPQVIADGTLAEI
jgi:hypothetical protein